jgi:hypothetical protein
LTNGNIRAQLAGKLLIIIAGYCRRGDEFEEGGLEICLPV